MLKNQKGITLISLAITIIVLMILATVTISTSMNLIESSRIRNNIVIMSLIRVEVEKIFEDFEFENDVANMKTLDTSKLTITGASKFDLTSEKIIPMQDNLSSKEKDLLEKKINLKKDSNIDVDNLWYIWSSSTLKELKIDYDEIISEDQYFIINYATGEVMISTGVKSDNDNLVIYSLTGLKELL